MYVYVLYRILEFSNTGHWGLGYDTTITNYSVLGDSLSDSNLCRLSKHSCTAGSAHNVCMSSTSGTSGL